MGLEGSAQQGTAIGRGVARRATVGQRWAVISHADAPSSTPSGVAWAANPLAQRRQRRLPGVLVEPAEESPDHAEPADEAERVLPRRLPAGPAPAPRRDRPHRTRPRSGCGGRRRGRRARTVRRHRSGARAARGRPPASGGSGAATRSGRAPATPAAPAVRRGAGPGEIGEGGHGIAEEHHAEPADDDVVPRRARTDGSGHPPGRTLVLVRPAASLRRRASASSGAERSIPVA